MKKKISLIQMNTRIKNVEKNFLNAIRLAKKALREKPDFIVFPECLNSGFVMDELENFCDENFIKTKEIFSAFAKENNVNLITGISNKENGKIYNSCLVFGRDGTLKHRYDKIHAFSFSGENEIIKTGEKAEIFELDGVKCGVMICYDIRFCELARIYALKGAQILFVLAQWPQKRISQWEILNLARAVENRFFVCAVNGCGEVFANKSQRNGGKSMIVSPNGDKILKFNNTQSVKTAEINLDEIKKIRAKMDVFGDRKVEIYKEIL